jgi:hypothetical protein
MRITVSIDKLLIEVEDEATELELSDEARTAARLWNSGAGVKEIAKALKLNSNGRYSTATDAGQAYICALRKALPKIFPYRKDQLKKA